ncbi:PcfJ domain-containing protein [Vibrio rarus]|uniref:PcfJ domain-containing protein n=1 Tax=Vibrio rarus TaxID=413403 RepID=UPI0021C406E9|nr:PcfJ domain-containing protein [Vibrio rarus]
MTVLTIPTTELGFEYDLELEAWNQKLQGYRTAGQWRIPLDGGIGVGFNYLRQYDDNGWTDTIPQDLLKATEDFPEFQYQMLWLAANSQAAKQLLETRPILLALVCNRHSVDNDQALAMCHLGQKQILAELGLDGTKASLKFIDKLTLDFTKGDEVEQVKRMLSPLEQRYLKLRHYSTVDYTALRLDQIFPFLSGSRLGGSLIEQGSIAQRVRLSEFQDAIQLGVALGVDNPVDVISNQRNLDRFRELHDRWAIRHNRWASQVESEGDIDWDAPYEVSLNGNDLIKPIINYRQLHKEGKEQMHCIAVYHHRIKGGRYLAFQMHQPQRLTIGIRRKPQGIFPFEIDQICGKRNRLPTAESKALIHIWFEQCKQNEKARSSELPFLSSKQ